MSQVLDFKALLNEKLTAMALEISELFDRMMAQHERQIRILQQRSRIQEVLDSTLKPNVVIRRSDVQNVFNWQRKDGSQQDNEPVPHHFKEEQKEVPLKHEQEEFQVFSHASVLVTSEDKECKPSAIHLSSLWKQGTDGHHNLWSERQVCFSDSVKLTNNSACEEVIEITNNMRTGSPGLDSVSGRSESEAEAEASERIPESASEQALKGVPTGKRLKTKIQTAANNKGSEVIFECTKCLKTFLWKTGSVRNASQNIVRCATCRRQLRQGNAVHHIPEQDKRFICSICKKSFTRPDNLSSHMLIHKGEKPYSCKVCKKCFTEPGHLKAHTRIHTGEKPFSCSVCKKSFTHRASRDRHERNHRGERPFSCSKCGADFKQRAHYLSHLVVHSRARPFSCSVCNKAYSRKSHVTSHMKRAHTDKPI